MMFNSWPFIIFLVITIIIYYLPLLKNSQLIVICISSLFFYAYNDIKLLSLLLISITINILASYYVIYGNKKNKKIIAITGVILNLAILLFFKYTPLIVNSFFNSKNSITEFLISIPLPIGISFFTFQGISLVVDTYKGKFNNHLVPRSLYQHSINILFFKSFFPQLISGPIVKAHYFIPQIKTKYFKNVDWEYAIKKIILGFFLKMVIADNLKDLTFWLTFPYFKGFSTITLIFMIFGYSFQIFSDFAGYSLLAIGFAKIFGYDFPINFNFPYISTSFKAFWKRWHISLSSFLMEYLYYPLGGNKKGKIRTYVNLFIVMFLGGLWHGAAWSYAIWGIYHGLILSVERLCGFENIFKKNLFQKTVSGLFIFLFVSIGWIFFKLPEFSHVVNLFSSLKNNFSLKEDTTIISYIIIYSIPVLFYHLIYLSNLKIKKIETLIYGLLLFLILYNSGSSGSFIYFQF